MSEIHLDRAAELLALARERMRTRHLALRTEQAYLQWLQRYVDFHGGRHPQELGAHELEQFLTHLAVHRKVSSATQNQALQALLFLYRHVLGMSCRGSRASPALHRRASCPWCSAALRCARSWRSCRALRGS
ncbi:MAG TPA: phage integrase N-terminal SAM-like domain-containing protein [Steroidobacteraceae bacterium]|nr:phage integrase N-terminal SAM-like domain-containing protein [Steroidobacteraceae bacterium]